MSAAAERTIERGASPVWLAAWAAQRFPLKNLLFFAPLYLAAVTAARVGVAAPLVRPGDLASFAAFWSFFLLLRVLDEHKDFAADAVAHPDRVLQRGLVTLAQLRWIGTAAVALQLGVSLWRDGGAPGAATGWWAASLAWTALMAREFFAPHWLRSHLVVYALTHMLVMPLLIAWAAALAGGVDGRVGAVAALAFTGGLAVEVARKLRAPEDERPTADTYTQSLGIDGAVGAAVATLAAATGLAAWAAACVGGHVPALGALVLGGAAAQALVRLLAFRRSPSAPAAAHAELAVALAVLAGLGCAIAAAVSAHAAVAR